MRKYIKLACVLCGKEFDKPLRDYNRQRKSGSTRFYCSLSCVAIVRNKEHPPKGNVDNLKKGHLLDDLAPFRYFMRGARRRIVKKGIDIDIELDYLKTLWESQNGICPLTGWKLVLPHGGKMDGWAERRPENASLDRIDSQLGYVKGNVRFVAYIANLAKHQFTDDDLKNFCQAVVNK